MRAALVLAVVNFIWNTVLNYNVRVVGQTRLAETFVSDLILGVIFFYLVSRVAEAKRFVEMIGYAVGGALGSLAGVILQAYFVK